MEKQNQACGCKKASCGCAGPSVERCPCGDRCECAPECRCAGGCACKETK